MASKFPEQIRSEINKQFFRANTDDLPLKARLSLEPLLRFWKNKFECGDSVFAESGRKIIEELEKIPALTQPVDDWSELEAHGESVKFLLSGLMPVGMHHSQFAYISSPFNIQSIYMTSALEKKLEGATLEFASNDGKCKNYDNMIIRACTLILDKVFGFNLFFDLPIVFSLRNNKLKISEYYKSIIDISFVDIKQKKKLKKPDEAVIKELLANIEDVDLWVKTIKPENYEFQGVVKAQLIDITEEEALSRLKYLLLEKNALVKEDNIRKIEQLMRDYFRCANLDLGISALDYPEVYTVEHPYKIRHDLLAGELDMLISPETKNSIIHQACKYREMVMIDDLEISDTSTEVETRLKGKGYRSMIVAPLISDGKIIGIIQIGSSEKDKFTSLDRLKMQDIMPMLATSLERSREEIDNLIDSIIREQYTAIHPAVEWKFIETAYNLMDQREKDPFGAKADPIVFHDVIPLFGESDIVGSSTTRNRAIQKDLVNNLDLAMELLEKANQRMSMPIIAHYKKKIKDHKESIMHSVNSNDEVQMIEFIKFELEPLFEMVKDSDPTFEPAIESYHEKLDPVLGIVYDERKAFEESVTLINDTISSYLEMKESEIQKALPHYFEKYKTDGVQFEMYIGQSLMRKGKFHDIHIRNMRIWQLILLCDIARLVEGLKPRMPIELETSQLILVHTNPLSIRFRMDEKRFDVDGAYNVRYEIIKKRIDKALVKESGERLTQPGTVSVVYAQERDRTEYEEYIEFLKEHRYIEDKVEHVELDKTRDVDGLKAFRLHVNFETDAHDLDPLQEEIRSALQQA